MGDANQVREAANRYLRTLDALAECRAQNERLSEQLNQLKGWPSPEPQSPPPPSFWDVEQRGPMPEMLRGLPKCEVDAWLDFFELWYG